MKYNIIRKEKKKEIKGNRRSIDPWDGEDSQSQRSFRAVFGWGPGGCRWGGSSTRDIGATSFLLKSPVT